MTTTKSQQGRLTDLGPDGRGFIVTSENPHHRIPFNLDMVKAASFEEAGLYEGAWVEFQLDGTRQIETVTAIPPVKFQRFRRQSLR
jgi:hypothetical protein